jgi:hypothetical protein
MTQVFQLNRVDPPSKTATAMTVHLRVHLRPNPLASCCKPEKLNTSAPLPDLQKFPKTQLTGSSVWRASQFGSQDEFSSGFDREKDDSWMEVEALNRPFVSSVSLTPTL